MRPTLDHFFDILLSVCLMFLLATWYLSLYTNHCYLSLAPPPLKQPPSLTIPIPALPHWSSYFPEKNQAPHAQISCYKKALPAQSEYEKRLVPIHTAHRLSSQQLFYLCLLLWAGISWHNLSRTRCHNLGQISPKDRLTRRGPNALKNRPHMGKTSSFPWPWLLGVFLSLCLLSYSPYTGPARTPHILGPLAVMSATFTLFLWALKASVNRTTAAPKSTQPFLT